MNINRKILNHDGITIRVNLTSVGGLVLKSGSNLSEHKLVRPFISHSNDDKPLINPILDFLCNCGIKPWVDEIELRDSIGLNLRKKIRDEIQTARPVCLMLFISNNSMVSGWVNDEIDMWLEVQETGVRLIPIFLEEVNIEPKSKLYPIIFPGGRKDRIYLERSDSDFKTKLVHSIMNHYGLDSAASVVFHAGHRLPWGTINIPKSWKKFDVLDFRSKLGEGDREYSPSEEEWIQIIEGLECVKTTLSNLKNIHLCGNSPVGFAAAVTYPWGRGSNVNLECYNHQTKEIWSSNYQSHTWPYSNPLFQHKIINEGADKDTAVLFIGNREDIYHNVQEFIEDKIPIYWAITPSSISSNIEELVNQSLGFILWILTKVKNIKLFFAIPFGLVGLISWNLSSVPVTIYDDTKHGSSKYIKVLTIK